MNLFAKIFLGFWLSTAAIIASWLLAGQAFTPFDEAISPAPREKSPFAAAPRRPGFPEVPEPGGMPVPGLREFGPGPRGIYRIYYGLQNVSRDQLLAWIKQHEKEEGVDIRLIDVQGREVFGRELIPGSEQIIERLAGFRRRALHREGDVVLFGQEFYRPEWGPLQMIIATRPPTSAVVKFLTQHLWLRLLLAVVISGAISYGISRYLTRPLKNLQQASRSLADGDLATRIAVPLTGGDETSELARDFNSMAEQLQAKVQAQKRLLGDVSHELRSPLARMRVALALAEKEPARIAEQLRRIELETERLDTLIEQLLSAPDTHGSMEDSIDLVALLSEICDDAGFEAQAESKGLQLDCAAAEAVVRSHGDLLKRAFENVIRNAVHYTQPGTTVSVRLSRQATNWLVSIEDRGPGVPEDQLEKIFEPFYRIDEARQRETGGFGLGLSIARRAIEQHGGTICATLTNQATQAAHDSSRAAAGGNPRTPAAVSDANHEDAPEAAMPVATPEAYRGAKSQAVPGAAPETTPDTPGDATQPHSNNSTGLKIWISLPAAET